MQLTRGRSWGQIRGIVMKRSRTLARVGCLALFASLLALAATPVLEAQQAGEVSTRVDVSKLGPQVGQRVPEFSLRDASGKTWTLPSIMGPKGAMLVFYRSADW